MMITRQDVIDIANEIYLDDCIWIDDSDSKPINDLVKFAKLVAAKEREACAKAIDEMHLYGFADVREFEIATLQDAAKAIRARGQE